jgi:hypothetical protein
MSKWRRLQKPDLDFKGTMSESHLCIDCGFDTAPGCLNRAEAEKEASRQIRAGRRNWKLQFTASSRSEQYFVHDHIWETAGIKPGGWDGCLCVGCLEQRIGRRLTPMDFNDHIFNTALPGTKRLMERQGRCDPLEAALDRAADELGDEEVWSSLTTKKPVQAARAAVERVQRSGAIA